MNYPEKNFLIIKDSLIKNILGPYAEDNFDLVGHLRQVKDAEAVSRKRLVQVFFTRSQIDWTTTRTKGNFVHEATYQIDFTIAVKSKMDVSVMLDLEATPEEKITALDHTLEATAIADKDLDNLYALIIEILRQPQNYNLGVDEEIVKIANMRPAQYQKNDPLENGGLVVVTASLFITCRIPETVSGEEGILSNKTIHGKVEINEDTVTKTEIETDLQGG